MHKTVEGIFRDGKIELLEPAPQQEEARVLVTFVAPSPRLIDLRERGIDEAQAADLRWRLGVMSEDWNHPDMDIYDQM